MSEDKRYFEVIDNKFWIITEGKTSMYVFQYFEEAIKHIFSRKDGFELFVIEGATLYEFVFEDQKFTVKNVLLPDMVKEWYRITGRNREEERAKEKKYTQRPAGYLEDERRTSESIEERLE